MGRDHLRAEADNTVELLDELALELVDVARAPLGTLAELDDSLLDAMVERLLPAHAGIESRIWNQGGICTGQSDEVGP